MLKFIVSSCCLSTVFLIGCDLNNIKLKLINKENTNIYYTLSMDTVLNEGTHLYKLNSKDSIYPNFVMGRGKGVWEHIINTESVDSSLHIFSFFYDAIPLNMITKEIINARKYNRLDFKVKDLEKIYWTVALSCP